MAIAFARVSIHSHAKGHSAVAASAYCTASRLVDERKGIVYDFTARKGAVFAELLLPPGINEVFQNREFLWNQVEASEKRKDAQVGKDIVLALPIELNANQHIELAKEFAERHFIKNGLPVELAIHDSESNQLIQQARQELVLNDSAAVIAHLAKNYSVFTKQEVQKLLGSVDISYLVQKTFRNAIFLRFLTQKSSACSSTPAVFSLRATKN